MSRYQKTLQQILCLMLCFSAWRGPVPMLHDHDAFPDARMRQQHVHLFHCDDCCQHSGVHWHFGNAKDLTGRSVFPEDQLPIDTAAFATSAATTSVVSQASDVFDAFNATSPILLMESFDSSPPTPHSKVCAPSHFLASLLMDAPLVAVTGVWLV